MEYNRSFALVEAVLLVGLTGWLFYLNSLSSRHDSDSKDPGPGGDKDSQNETDRS